MCACFTFLLIQSLTMLYPMISKSWAQVIHLSFPSYGTIGIHYSTFLLLLLLFLFLLPPLPPFPLFLHPHNYHSFRVNVALMTLNFIVL